MSPNEKKSLIEKIDGLSPKQRERVEGYVDALLDLPASEDKRRETSVESQEMGSGRSIPPEASRRVSSEEVERGGDNERRESRERFLSQEWRGALSDLKDEYTSLELEEEIKKQWRKMAHD